MCDSLTNAFLTLVLENLIQRRSSNAKAKQTFEDNAPLAAEQVICVARSG
jgi:hypothetical protein